MAGYVKRLSADIVNSLLSDDVKNSKSLADAAQEKANEAYSKAVVNSLHTHTANQVGESISGMGWKELGSYALLYRNSVGSSLNAGAVYSGSGLRAAGVSLLVGSESGQSMSVAEGSSVSGTWRSMGKVSSNSSRYPMTIFLRIY
jgi:hypothetical protein